MASLCEIQSSKRCYQGLTVILTTSFDGPQLTSMGTLNYPPKGQQQSYPKDRETKGETETEKQDTSSFFKVRNTRKKNSSKRKGEKENHTAHTKGIRKFSTRSYFDRGEKGMKEVHELSLFIREKKKNTMDFITINIP